MTYNPLDYGTLVEDSSESEPSGYDAFINEAAENYGVDPDLIRSIISVESGGDLKAVSGKGATGLMQLMPDTAKAMGVTNITDPRQNILGGTKYLSQQLKAADGDIEIALARYNAGPTAVKKHGGIPPFKETQDYVKKVTSIYNELKPVEDVDYDPLKYGTPVEEVELGPEPTPPPEMPKPEVQQPIPGSIPPTGVPLPPSASIPGVTSADSPAANVLADAFSGNLPAGAGALQKPLETAVDFWSQYFMTPEEEKAMAAKHPNLMAARYAAASLLLPGISEKFASPTELEEFVKKPPEEQSKEILGLAGGYALFGAGTKGAISLANYAAKKYPWLNKTLGNAIKDSTWFRRLTIKERGVALQSAARKKTAGMSDEQVAEYLNNYYTNYFKEKGVKPSAKPAEEPTVKVYKKEEVKAKSKEKAPEEIMEAETIIPGEVPKRKQVTFDSKLPKGGREGKDFTVAPAGTKEPVIRRVYPPWKEWVAGEQQDVDIEYIPLGKRESSRGNIIPFKLKGYAEKRLKSFAKEKNIPEDQFTIEKVDGGYVVQRKGVPSDKTKYAMLRNGRSDAALKGLVTKARNKGMSEKEVAKMPEYQVLEREDKLPPIKRKKKPSTIQYKGKQYKEAPAVEKQEVKAPLAPKPVEKESPLPNRPPGKRWTGDRGAMPGEPSLFLDGDMDTAVAAIVENVSDTGDVLYKVFSNEGEELGTFPTVKSAATAAEKMFPKAPSSEVIKARAKADKGPTAVEIDKVIGKKSKLQTEEIPDTKKSRDKEIAFLKEYSKSKKLDDATRKAIDDRVKLLEEGTATPKVQDRRLVPRKAKTERRKAPRTGSLEEVTAQLNRLDLESRKAGKRQKPLAQRGIEKQYTIKRLEKDIESLTNRLNRFDLAARKKGVKNLTPEQKKAKTLMELEYANLRNQLNKLQSTKPSPPAKPSPSVVDKAGITKKPKGNRIKYDINAIYTKDSLQVDHADYWKGFPRILHFQDTPSDLMILLDKGFPDRFYLLKNAKRSLKDNPESYEAAFADTPPEELGISELQDIWDATPDSLRPVVPPIKSIDDLFKGVARLGYEQLQFIDIVDGVPYARSSAIPLKSYKPKKEVPKPPVGKKYQYPESKPKEKVTPEPKPEPKEEVIEKPVEKPLGYSPEDVVSSGTRGIPNTDKPGQTLHYEGTMNELQKTLDAESMFEVMEEVKKAGYDAIQFVKFINKCTDQAEGVYNAVGEPIDISDLSLDHLNLKPAKEVKIKTKTGKVVLGSKLASAGANLTITKRRLLKDIEGKGYVMTILNELIQNSLDALRGISAKAVEIYVKDGTLTVVDYGKGMSPEEMENDFVNLFEQGTKGEDDLGGFGFAKLPIMGWPDNFKVYSVWKDPKTGTKYLSRVAGNKKDYMENHLIPFNVQVAPKGVPEGTVVTIRRNEGLEDYRVLDKAKILAEKHRTGHPVKLFHNQGFGTDTVTDVGSPKWSDVKSKYPELNITINGSEISVKFADKTPTPWNSESGYSVAANVYNKGLNLPDIPKFTEIGKFRLSKKPDFSIEINFTKTPSASDEDNYPFLVNRTRLLDSVEQEIVSEIRDVIGTMEADIQKEIKKDIKRLFTTAKKVGGTKVIIPFKEDDIVVEVFDIIDNNKEVFEDLGKLYKEFGDMLANYTDVPPHEYAITTYAGVHGFRPKSGILPEDYIVANPFSYLSSTYGGDNKLVSPTTDIAMRVAASLLVQTLEHEAAHSNVSQHYSDFVGEYHRIHSQIQSKTENKGIYDLEVKAYEFFKKHGQDIQAITEAIRDIQESGSLSQIFSEYTPEFGAIEKSSVDATSKKNAQRPGETWREIIGGTNKILQRTDLEKLRELGWTWKQAGLESAPSLGSRPNKMWRMIEPTPGRKRPVILTPPTKDKKKQPYSEWAKKRREEDSFVNKLLAPLKNERGSVPVGELTQDVKRSVNRTIKLADYYLGALSTRAEKIDPSIRNKLIEFELDHNRKIESIIKQVLPFIRATNKMSKEDYKAFDFARKNSDTETINKFLDKYEDIGLKKEYENFRLIDDMLINEAINAGFKVNYLKEHNPREVRDFDGLMDYLYETGDKSTIDLFIKQREKRLGRSLTRNEQIDLVNSIFRGYADERITLSKPGQLKIRKLRKLTPEMAEFFGDSNSAMLRYISDVVSAIEARKIFGKGVNKESDIYNMEDTIGAYILNLKEQGKLPPSKELELKSILKARFAPVGTKGIVTTIKNMSVIDVMGSPASAIRQVGDIGWSMVESGVIPTLAQLPRAMAGKSRFTKESLGISKIGAEFSDKTTSAKMVDAVFKAIGLTRIDAIGKEVLINSVYTEAVKKARSSNPKVRNALRKELEEFLTPEKADALMKTFAEAGDSRDARLYMLRKLSEYQPATLSELPQGFISGGNMRIFYMLKSFDLKRFDAYRRKVFQQLKTPGKRAEGLRNLFKIAFFMTLMEATGDMLIDLFLGRPIDFSSMFLNRLTHTFMSRYTTQRLKKEGAGSALLEQILPPTQFVDSLTKDIVTYGDDKGTELVKSIPMLGKWWYYRYGKGAEKTKKQEEKRRKEEAKEKTNAIIKMQPRPKVKPRPKSPNTIYRKKYYPSK